jgi:shikimate kinase
MNAILFGFKGCGKTYFGKRLSKKISLPFIDTDDLIVEQYFAQTGKTLTPRAIYEIEGESFFRHLEQETISTLISYDRHIIAVGGATLLSHENFILLHTIGHLIYLEARLETLQSRNTSLAAGPLDSLYHQRTALYRQIPAPCIKVDEGDESEVLESICTLLSL